MPPPSFCRCHCPRRAIQVRTPCRRPSRLQDPDGSNRIGRVDVAHMRLDRMSLLPGQAEPMLRRLLRRDDGRDRPFARALAHLRPELGRDLDAGDGDFVKRLHVGRNRERENKDAPGVSCSVDAMRDRARLVYNPSIADGGGCPSAGAGRPPLIPANNSIQRAAARREKLRRSPPPVKTRQERRAGCCGEQDTPAKPRTAADMLLRSVARVVCCARSGGWILILCIVSVQHGIPALQGPRHGENCPTDICQENQPSGHSSAAYGRAGQAAEVLRSI